MSDSTAPAAFVAPAPSVLAPHFPGYEIESLIATGGMGAVYLAVQKSLERNVALKILPPELSADAGFRDSFEAEAKAMGRLNHPNLIGVFDFGEVGGMLYIIMEFVPGKSLFHSADGIAIDQNEVVRLVTGICAGLAHAHEHGILHRDIKPSNILLDLNAEPKIGDFGLARPADWTIQEGEEIFGTPHYTAPEVVANPHSVDHRADIFSVGVLLHELLTGKLPADDPRPPSVISRCDIRFDAIVKRATQPLAAARYHSAKEMAADLHAIGATLAIKSPQSPRPGPHGPPVTSHRIPHTSRQRGFRGAAVHRKKSSGSPALLLFLVVLAAGGAAFFLTKKPAPPATRDPADSGVIVVPVGGGPKVPSDTPEIHPEPDHHASPQPDENIVKTPDADPPDPGDATPDSVTPETGAAGSPASSNFDAAAFVERGRGNLRTRALPLAASHRSRIAANLKDFTSALERQARRASDREAAAETVADNAETWTAEGRIPADLPYDLEEIPDSATLHASFLQKQTAIDDTLHNEIAKLSAAYVLGLNKQAETLRAAGNSAATATVKEEVDQVLRDPEYFQQLMLGDSTDSE
jgi:serine/threonine protein kinase